jgi:hypothetical protein
VAAQSRGAVTRALQRAVNALYVRVRGDPIKSRRQRQGRRKYDVRLPTSR